MTRLCLKQPGNFVAGINQEQFRFKESVLEHKDAMRREMAEHGSKVRDELSRASTMRLGQGNMIIKESK